MSATRVRVVVVVRVPHERRWRATGAAAAFLLAAVAGVAGNQLSGHLTWAIAVFVALLAAGMAVTYLLERHADGRTSLGEDQRADDTGTTDWHYDMRGAQGVQFGSHNRQVNYFGADPDQDQRE